MRDPTHASPPNPIFFLAALRRIAQYRLVTLIFPVAYPISYESWIIYNFLALMFAYTGGPGHVVTWMEGRYVEVRAGRPLSAKK